MAEPRSWKPRRRITMAKLILLELVLPLVLILGGGAIYAWAIR